MKIKRLQREMHKRSVDLALIISWKNKDPNMAYFAGIDLDYSFLLIPKKGNSKLITSKLEYERAKKHSEIEDVIMLEKPVFLNLAKKIGRYKKNIGINKSVVSLNEFGVLKKNLKGKRFSDIEDLMVQTRKKKDAAEIRNIKKACRITDQIFSKIINNFNFKTGREIADFIRKEAYANGCTLSFEPIVASGKYSSMPHSRADDKKLKSGFLVMDFGVNYNGYMSDMTRTIYLGKPSVEEKRLYSMLLEIQKKAIGRATPGMKAKDLMAYVQESLGIYNDKFIHGLGHGIGVEIHELPSIHAESKDIFEAGDVFTVEPGIYFEGRFGIRIEDDILLEKNKTTILTKSSKDLILKKVVA